MDITNLARFIFDVLDHLTQFSNTIYKKFRHDNDTAFVTFYWTCHKAC